MQYYRCEVIVIQANHPSKYVIRKYMKRRSHETAPPPAPEELRRQLGWRFRICDSVEPTDDLPKNPTFRSGPILPE